MHHQYVYVCHSPYSYNSTRRYSSEAFKERSAPITHPQQCPYVHLICPYNTTLDHFSIIHISLMNCGVSQDMDLYCYTLGTRRSQLTDGYGDTNDTKRKNPNASTGFPFSHFSPVLQPCFGTSPAVPGGRTSHNIARPGATTVGQWSPR